MEITHFFPHFARNMVSPYVFFFPYTKKRGTNKNEGNRRKGNLMSKRRHDNTDISFYFLSITLELCPTNIVPDNSSLESALNVCCLCEGGSCIFLPGRQPSFLKITVHDEK